MRNQIEEYSTPAADAAVRYALAGVPILPLYDVRDGRCACGRDACDRPGKHPRTPNGVHNTTDDVQLVARWWRWWPAANVGAATGHVFDVWDIDLPAAEADALAARYLGHLTPSWPMSRTGSGGTHVLFAPTGHGNRTRFLPGCDWRGRGGYVVLPPSRHVSGQRYQWLTMPPAGHADPLGYPIFPPAPVSLLQALAPQPMRATPGGRWRAKIADPYAAAALRRECDAVAAMPPDSGRNNALNRAAFNLGQLVAAGLLDKATVAAALSAVAARCGLGDREAARTIASGLAAGGRQPRTRRGGAA